jgi:hypothetical protein
MKDDYILRQERKIKKRLWELFRLRHLAVFGLCLFSLMVLFSIDPPPELWTAAEITVTDMEHRSKPFLYTKSGNPGWALTDQNGERYWIYETDGQLQLGQTYSVRYVDRGYYRFFMAATQGDAVLIDLQKSMAQWHRDLRFWFAALILFLLTFLVIAHYVRCLIADDVIRQHRKKILAHRQKKLPKQ